MESSITSKQKKKTFTTKDVDSGGVLQKVLFEE